MGEAMSEDLKASARRWAWEYMLCNAELPEHAQDDEYRAAQHILATTSPLTMADEDWDEGEHYLAGCMTQYGEMVMLRPHGANLLVHDLNSGLTEIWDRDDATPNGKKYELREVTDKHPETLRTAEDYEDAPVGTIVANSGRFPLIKRERNVWANMFDDTFSNGYLADTSLKVLRWGWGE